MWNVPDRAYALRGGLTCPVGGPDVQVWQDHVIRHPFGTEALFNNKRANGGHTPWNDEGWDTTAPPVLSLDDRRRLVGAIRALSVHGSSCTVPRLEKETYGGDPPKDWKACPSCPTGLAHACEETTRRVGEAYRSVMHEIVEAVAEPRGTVVRIDALWSAIRRYARNPSDYEGLVVLRTGYARRDGRTEPIARAHRADGVRVDFYLERSTLEWRTTLRVRAGHPASFLLNRLDGASGLPLAGSCLIPKDWAERHGVES